MSQKEIIIITIKRFIDWIRYSSHEDERKERGNGSEEEERNASDRWWWARRGEENNRIDKEERKKERKTAGNVDEAATPRQQPKGRNGGFGSDQQTVEAFETPP